LILTEQEKQYLEENESDIKTEIKKRFRTSELYNHCDAPGDRINDAFSMSVVAIKEYNPEKFPNKNVFIAQRSILRLKDEERKEGTISKETINHKKLYRKIKDDLIKQGITRPNDQEIHANILNASQRKKRNITNAHNTNIHYIGDSAPSIPCNTRDFLEWEEYKEYLFDYADQYFDEVFATGYRAKHHHAEIYKELVKYYVGLAEDDYQTDIQSIADKFGYSKPRIYQLMYNGVLENFFEKTGILN